MTYQPASNFLALAEREVYIQYGDTVSATAKGKGLQKFGRNSNVGTSEATVMQLQGSELKETYVSSNIIDSISSSNAGDNQQIKYEYHTLSGGNFTFGVGTVTLNGQTRVALPVACARISRAYNISSTDFAGTVYVYENSTLSAGKPTDDTKIHMAVTAVAQQSTKCSTTFSSVDYAFITGVALGVNKAGGGGTNVFVDFRLNVREYGQTFRVRSPFQTSRDAGAIYIPVNPYIIVPPNSDVLMSAQASASSTDVTARFDAILALKQ